ncbi:immunoglobulin superfamily member 6 [Trematomus bernacchii]|uniref:immunoglobulin superfamily member 6 n=1 Tax=Trematomus bernacchii TaxID=40690 RepID=UPI00146D2A6D|nr:immunoglobulin superfamily member 6 [Trematomus bernacchii]
MDRLFCFSLLLSYLPVTESMEGCLSQPNKMIWRKTGQTVFLKCLSSNCLTKEGLQFEWFAFKENVHLPLNVSKNPHKYSLDKASLNIKSLHTNESGIYYCAVFSGYTAKGTSYVALGTTLVVTEYISPLVRHILLWLSFALLAIYSLAIVTLILKKCGCKTSVCRKRGETDKTPGEKHSFKRTHFRDVLQEMYSKRNLEKGIKAENKKPSQAEAPGTEFNGSTDDIYQNV